MTLTFVGHGYVGLVTAAIFADLGNKIWVIGHTPEKIENLKKGIIPIYEPGLAEIVKRNVDAKRLLFTLDYDQAIPESDVIFIAVGTPSSPDGSADLSVVFEVTKKIGEKLSGYTVIATKSTVPVGTYKQVREIIEKVKPEKAEYDLASVPEFLREGQAISDTLHPDRVVIGTESEKARELLSTLHEPIDAPIVLTNIPTAEMIKYAANSFLATKISFANSIAYISELAGADGLKVIEGIGMDKRIGNLFLNAGAGYGGSCFPKDVKALIDISKNLGHQFTLLEQVDHVNNQTVKRIAEKVSQFLKDGVEGKQIGILGLSFKPDTDDMRYAPAITVISELQKKGAKIKAYDPVAITNARKLLKDVEYGENAYDVLKDCDVMVIMTEWNEFKELDLEKAKELMRGNYIVDGRNIFIPEKVKKLGFEYKGVGR